MTDDVFTHSFTEGEIRLATVNYEAQEWLTRELFTAYEMSGLSEKELARLLELDVPTVQDWLSGDVDLTMSELRHLATALDAHVTYRVEPIVNRLPEWVKGLSGIGWEKSGNDWLPERLAV